MTFYFLGCIIIPGRARHLVSKTAHQRVSWGFLGWGRVGLQQPWWPSPVGVFPVSTRKTSEKEEGGISRKHTTFFLPQGRGELPYYFQIFSKAVPRDLVLWASLQMEKKMQSGEGRGRLLSDPCSNRTMNAFLSIHISRLQLSWRLLPRSFSSLF